MKIYASVEMQFRKDKITSTTFTIGFNAITETGIVIGGMDKVVTVPSTITTATMNTAIANEVTASINASGLYKVQKTDTVILFGASPYIS